MTDDNEIANVLNKHFVNSVRYLAERGGCIAHVLDINDEKDPLENIVNQFQLYLSITAIEQKNSKKYFILFCLQPFKLNPQLELALAFLRITVTFVLPC